MEKLFLTDNFREVLTHEGVVSITSWGGSNDPHVVNTWNSYLTIQDNNKILIPAGGFRKTQKNVEANNKVIITLGAKDVLGYKGDQGTGFVIEGYAEFIISGTEYDLLKDKFPFLSRVLKITVVSIKQTL